jgi:Asp-tRNA(Asn)/Glu-tRNA(Gln) amidotransferase A subunit family amidase
MRRPLAAVLAVALLASGAPAAPPKVDPAYERPIEQLQADMAAGRLTSVDLVRAYRARIAAYDQAGPALNAIVTLAPDALEQARRLDAERAAKGPRGPLHGIPVLVKDNYDTADMPTSGGTLALANLRPGKDAYAVARLRAAGAVILGKTTMHELAVGVTTVSSLTGLSRNAYDPRRSPGGSSGGTGAAIAASFAAAGMGSDTCGSIRIPAAFGNLFGMRETRGLSSRTGIIPLSTTQDIGGPLARNVRDLAMMMDATVGADPADPSTAAAPPQPAYAAGLQPGGLKRARIGILRAEFADDRGEADILAKAKDAFDRMKAEGATIVDVTIPDLEKPLGETSVIKFEFRDALAAYLKAYPDAPVHSLHEILAAGLEHEQVEATLRKRDTTDPTDAKAYGEAMAKRDVVRAMILAAIEKAQVDVLVYPTTASSPPVTGLPPSGRGTCQYSAGTGLPALALPIGVDGHGFPVGLDLLGKPFAERQLLDIAYGWELAVAPRHAPLTTPALARGRVPGAIVSSTRIASPSPGGSAARVDWRYEATTATLTYKGIVTPGPGDQPVSILIQRSDGARPGPVIAVLGRNFERPVAGRLQLEPRAQADLLGGRLTVNLFTRRDPLGVGRVPIVMKLSAR